MNTQRLYEKIKTHFTKRYDLYLFLFISLITLKWFAGNNYIHQIDSLFSLDPNLSLQKSLFSWSNTNSLGLFIGSINMAPFYLFQILLIKSLFILGYWKQIVWSQKIIYFLVVFFSFVFINIFLKEVFKVLIENKIQTKEQIIIFVASIFYVINPFTISWIFWRFQTWTLFWPALPLIGFLFLRFTSKRENYILIFLLIFFMSPLIGGITLLGFFLMISFLLILTMGFYKKLDLIKVGLFILLFLLMNTIILIPQINSISQTKDIVETYSYSNKELLDFGSKYTTPLNIFTFMGNYLFYTNYENFPYEWADYYQDNIFIQIGLFIIPLLFIISLLYLLNEKKIEIKKFFLVVSISILLLFLIIKGASGFLSILNYSLLSIPLAGVIFRHPYDKFMPLFVILFSLSIFYSLWNISKHIKIKKLFMIIIITILFIFLFINYPFFTGEIIHSSDKITIPQNYLSLNNNLLIQNIFKENTRVLILPFSNSGEYSYNFSGKINHPNTKSIMDNFIKNSQVIQFPNTNNEKEILKNLSKVLINKDEQEFINRVNLLGINEIIIQKDSSTKYLINEDSKLINENYKLFILNLEKDNYIIKVFDNENIVIYKIKSIFIKPILYFDNSSFQKINPTKYHIYISNLKEPQNLSFLESYNKDWKLYLKHNPSSLWCKPIEYFNDTQTTECEHTQKFFEGEELQYLYEKPIFDDTHEMAFDYANGWTIDPEYIKNNYSTEYYTTNPDGSINVELVMYFKPQSYFYLGLIISLTTLILCLIYLIYDWRKTIKFRMS